MPVTAIASVLDRMIECHQQLQVIGVRKREAILQNSIQELSALVHKESKCIREIQELDQQRILKINEYLVSRCYKMNPNITVSELVKLVFKAEEKQLLMDRQEKLLHELLQLKELNETNRQLVEQSLGYIDLSLDLLTATPEQDAVYAHPAQQGQSKRKNAYFDTRA
ncbi:flagellar protein FlgN [Paenibacillus lutrae]|uniref:Flagellar protein FlgN n=1 Tax=Paenibacillus lutrae TaxID=2078573 RepID=A0A7X3FKQ4_9BACL|nr:flagellar protein FlgN [Paenibacillus lutrae]MVP01544.1 flagellar protein FlgN [Paenibacillus lutrae]